MIVVRPTIAERVKGHCIPSFGPGCSGAPNGVNFQQLLCGSQTLVFVGQGRLQLKEPFRTTRLAQV